MFDRTDLTPVNIGKAPLGFSNRLDGGYIKNSDRNSVFVEGDQWCFWVACERGDASTRLWA